MGKLQGVIQIAPKTRENDSATALVSPSAAALVLVKFAHTG